MKTMLNSKNKSLLNLITWLVRLSAFFVFFGRGFEHFFFDAPYRSVLWDPDIMYSFINNFTNFTWTEYVTSKKVDTGIEILTKITGIFYIICAALALFVKPENIRLGKLLIYGSILLILLSTLFYKEKFYKFGQLVEYSCQMFSPLFLYLILYVNINKNKLAYLLKVAIALTFFGHGLYALNVYIRPGYWTDMASSSLRFVGLYFSEYTINQIIFYAGLLDMAIVIGIFLPKKFSYPFLVWAAIWGYQKKVDPKQTLYTNSIDKSLYSKAT